MQPIVRKIHKYLSFFISLQLLLWTISGIYFAFNKIEHVRGEQYRIQPSATYSLKKIEFEIPDAVSLAIKKRLDKTIIRASTKAGMRYFDENGDALMKRDCSRQQDGQAQLTVSTLLIGLVSC